MKRFMLFLVIISLMTLSACSNSDPVGPKEEPPVVVIPDVVITATNHLPVLPSNAILAKNNIHVGILMGDGTSKSFDIKSGDTLRLDGKKYAGKHVDIGPSVSVTINSFEQYVGSNPVSLIVDSSQTLPVVYKETFSIVIK